MVTGPLLKVAIALMKAHIFLIALFHLKDWNKTVVTIRLLQGKIKKYIGPNSIQKIALVGGRFHWDMYGEGWPSSGFIRNVKRECSRVNASPYDHVGMRNVLFGLTTKCPLQCEHCYEWNNLNVRERLGFADLQTIIEKLVAYGVGQIHLGGGEPMMRFEEIIQLLKLYSHQAGFWIVTSGYQFTAERAILLKASGLTGVCVSIDHHEEEPHNNFRHYRQSYEMAQTAARAARKAGLVTALSLCATREYTQRQNIASYVKMGRKLGVSFIQFLEPRAVGHYEGKDVMLSDDQKKILESVFLETNTTRAHQKDPIVIYHEYYKPTLGCRGSGNGALYIDPLGEVHACPFCRKSSGNMLRDEMESCVERLLGTGCPVPLPHVHASARTSQQAPNADAVRPALK